MTEATISLCTSAFFGDKEKKALYIERLEDHYVKDDITQGQGWSGGKGCMIGCIFHDYAHQKFPFLLGLPIGLAYTVDTLFELMSNKDAKEFPLEFLRAIQPGKDYSNILPTLIINILTNKTWGMVSYIKDDRPHSKEAKALLRKAKAFIKKEHLQGVSPETLFKACSTYGDAIDKHRVASNIQSAVRIISTTSRSSRRTSYLLQQFVTLYKENIESSGQPYKKEEPAQAAALLIKNKLMRLIKAVK